MAEEQAAPMVKAEFFESESNLLENIPSHMPIKYIESVEDKEEVPSLLKPVMLCVAIAFGGFIIGWDVGVIGGISNMESFQNNFGPLVDLATGRHYFPDILIGLVISIFSIGGALGGLTMAKTGDWRGRKFGLYLSMFVYCIGLGIQLVHDVSWWQFFAGRMLTGLAVGSTAVLVPMFLSESAPLTIRGAMTTLYQLMITFGIMMGNILNYAVRSKLSNPLDNISWQLPIYMGFIWAAVIVVGLLFTPESANFLVTKKHSIEEAKISFAIMNGISEDNDASIDFIEQTLKEQHQTERHACHLNLFEFITGKPKYAKRLLVGILVMTFQQLSGINYFFYYGTSLFEKANFKDPYLPSIFLSTVNFVATFGGVYLVESLGRKYCLLLGSLGMFSCMLIYSTVGTFALEYRSSGIVMIAFTCIYIMFFATTLGPVSFVVVSELFPMKTKAISMAICSSFNWMFGFMISLLTPVITTKIGFAYGYFFAGCLILSAIFVWAMVPETKGKSESDINTLYETEY
ncbi:related to Hexose transporter HXT14 [Zygosaccharomyces bailii]|nr:related to Hexose transporter HXT14 [Zygosaccharomyces bailii]